MTNRRSEQPKECIDCARENEGRAHPQRPAPHRGPRCYTHHHRRIKADKAKAHERHVQRTYHLEPGEYAQLYEYQDKQCFICRRAKGITRNLTLDHDHSTTLPRGLLCKTCNALLGHIRDDEATALRIFLYLHDPPYRRMTRGLPPT